MSLKTFKKNIFLLSLCLIGFSLSAQKITTIITGATIHVGNGEIIENGVVVLSNGKIELVGKTLKTLYKNAKTIDAKGKHIYPGLIGMNTIVGLNEIDAARATRDFNEQGSVNPNVRALIAYNTDSKIIPTLVFNGILFTQVVPQGGLVSGTSSLMKTQGWNWEDAAYKKDDGVHINWPEFNPYGNAEEQKAHIEKEMQQLSDIFEQAEQYSKLQKPETFNARLNAMKPLFSAQAKLYVHVNSAKGIITAINFIKKYPAIKMVLVDAADAYLVTEIIRENNIPVVLTNIHRLPQRSAEDVDQPYKTASQLMKAGILVAISRSGSWEARNLAFNAGTTAGYGLSKEEALATITLNAAKIMGVDAQMGSIEKGKDASIMICSGDILDMRTNTIEQAFILGEDVDLSSQQKALGDKYLKKLGLKVD